MIDFFKKNLLWILVAVLFCALPFLLIPTQTTPERFRQNVEKSGFELPESDQEIVRVWLVGDTTLYPVVEAITEATGDVCWGNLLNRDFNNRVFFLNVAQEAKSSYAFLSTDGYYSLNHLIRENDIVLIQFGCCDAIPDDEDAETRHFTDPKVSMDDADESCMLPDGTISYKAILYHKLIEPIREAGATPVLISSVVQLNARGIPDPSYRLAPYRDAMRELSETYDVPFYDVLNDSTRQFTRIYTMEGVEGARTLYGRAAYDENVLQMNYLSKRGAQIVSDYVRDRLLEDFPQLNDYLSAQNESAADSEDAVIFDPGA